MPHAIAAMVAILTLAATLALSMLFAVGEMELSFTSRNALAMMHPG